MVGRFVVGISVLVGINRPATSGGFAERRKAHAKAYGSGDRANGETVEEPQVKKTMKFEDCQKLAKKLIKADPNDPQRCFVESARQAVAAMIYMVLRPKTEKHNET